MIIKNVNLETVCELQVRFRTTYWMKWLLPENPMWESHR